VVDLALLSGGLRNTNYRVQLAGGTVPLVLRLYTADPATCAREVALLRLIEGRVPSPRILRSDPSARPPWSLMTFINGEPFDLAQEAPGADLRAMASSAGSVLARIHAFGFEHAGSFSAGLDVHPFDAQFRWSRWLAAILEHAEVRRELGADLAQRLRRFVDDNAWRVEHHHEAPCLLHADYKPWNLLLQDNAVVGVVDWEFAFAGSRLNDIANFLRHSGAQPPEYETGFVAGYMAAGGVLPHNWKRLARLTDLMSLVDMLDRMHPDSGAGDSLRPLIELTLQELE
jgi:aminoglycoside phosphotransferase (APT) family kinase protein